MTDVQLVVATGLFSLGGVALGAVLMPFTNLYLERKREQRAADRAKLLVAGELLQAELILRTASASAHWPPVEDMNAFLPTSAWQENKSSLAGKIDEDLWNELILAYALLESDRARFAAANRLPAGTPLAAREAKGLQQTSQDLGRLRRKLGVGGGWLSMPRINDEVKRRLE
jgi:hypothetical protein